jgi:NADH:ubiquinone oxidoreductase subunit 4 (subunit M)
MRLVYGTIALIVVGFIESLYRAIFFWGTLNASGITGILVSIANFFLFLAGPIALIYIIIGSYFYITAAGDEERADKGKKILLYTFFATILLLLSYTFLVEIVGLNLF